MTSQTKYYVELSDILALRCECKRCNSTISLPFAQMMRTESLYNCPNCNESWTVFNHGQMGGSLDKPIRAFMESLKQLDDALHHRSELSGDGGFLLSLEVRKEADPNSSASHGAGAV
jgi:hypothetical protein